MKLSSAVVWAASLPLAIAAATGFRTVGSSGCTPQMVFLAPYTKTAIFIDNYHPNFGATGVNLQTGAPGAPYKYNDGSGLYVFGTEYNLLTNTVRALRPRSNTFCSAGAFFPDGTLVNAAGAEPSNPLLEGFDKIRTYAPGPCANDQCTMDWVEKSTLLQHYRWYPTMQTLTDGSIVVVGGSDKGSLVLNEANINVPTYELLYPDGRRPPGPVTLPILQFTDSQNLQPDYSYNLYPIMHLLPNSAAANQVFTVAGSRAVIWDYKTNGLVKTLPNTPLHPRAFPSSATSVMYPLKAPNYTPTVLVCGGSSRDIPDPQALNDCYIVNPYDANPTWTRTDNMPDGPRTMGDGINLPDGTILIINGARKGSGGGFQAEVPALTPIIYNPIKPVGQRFTVLGGTNIPRMYHSVATLLASGEVIVAGSNPAVGYSASGKVPSGWPYFDNNGHRCALKQQQYQNTSYPTEYRVENFAPPYMAAAARPVISASPATVGYDRAFTLTASLSGKPLGSTVQVMFSNPGFHTHGTAMGQRMAQLSFTASSAGTASTLTVTAPRDASVMPPGVYLVFVVNSGIPSEGSWVKLA